MIIIIKIIILKIIFKIMWKYVIKNICALFSSTFCRFFFKEFSSNETTTNVPNDEPSFLSTLLGHVAMATGNCSRHGDGAVLTSRGWVCSSANGAASESSSTESGLAANSNSNNTMTSSQSITDTIANIIRIVKVQRMTECVVVLRRFDGVKGCELPGGGLREHPPPL